MSYCEIGWIFLLILLVLVNTAMFFSNQSNHTASFPKTSFLNFQIFPFFLPKSNTIDKEKAYGSAAVIVRDLDRLIVKVISG